MMKNWIGTLPLATALRASLAHGYSASTFGKDLMAALIVSLVALPLAMALAIAMGLPPQHGIYTAIVAGILTPLLGGSITQVSGPTAAFVVIVAPIITQYGLRGIIIAEMMAGVMLIGLAWAKIGRFIAFIPYPVTTGFTAGIAVVLGTLSLNDLLGLGIEKLQGHFIEKLLMLLKHLPDFQIQEATIGLVSLALMFKGRHLNQKIPSVVTGILAGCALAAVFQHFDFSVSTIGSRFSYYSSGVLKHGIPPFPPELHFFGGHGLFAWPSYAELQTLSMPGFVIAALAALESLLSATVADGMAKTRHNPNAELAAIGIANIFSGFASGIPATGAIARTATNVKSGAQTVFASSLHAVLIMLYVLALAPLISYIPMASLAALLMVTAYNMSHYQQFFRILKIAPREDSMVLLTCFGLTVFIDMVAGVSVGIMLASLLFIERMSLITETRVYEGAQDGVQVCRISGPLFFATVERAFDQTALSHSASHTLIFDLLDVPLIDMTAMVAFKNLLVSAKLSGKRIILCARPDILETIMQKLASVPALNVQTANSVEAALKIG